MTHISVSKLVMNDLWNRLLPILTPNDYLLEISPLGNNRWNCNQYKKYSTRIMHLKIPFAKCQPFSDKSQWIKLAAWSAESHFNVKILTYESRNFHYKNNPFNVIYHQEFLTLKDRLYIEASLSHYSDVMMRAMATSCLLKRLFRRISQKTSKLRVTGLCERNLPWTGEFPGPH